MSIDFEELDFQSTPLGEISLRRRADPLFRGEIVYEVKLGDEYLMSSLFTAAEIRLATLALAGLDAPEKDVVVGGLGLGYTAAAVLDDATVRTLTVVEVLAPVIDWHRRGLVPLGERLASDARCTLLNADFFALAGAPADGFPGAGTEGSVHAVLLDIDHSPSHWLSPENSTFYTPPSLGNLARKLLPGGVFGMWSNDPPDTAFLQRLAEVFEAPESHVVTFPNPYTGGESTATVYLARRSG